MSKKKLRRRTNLSFGEVCVPSASHTRAVTEVNALKIALENIEKAKRAGNSKCWIMKSGNNSSVPQAVIQRLTNAGYDIECNYYTSDREWFVKASWLDGCCGRIFKKVDFSKFEEVSIQQLFE